MTTHEMTEEHGHLCLGGELLLVRYEEGDCDTISARKPDLESLRKALYDEIECSDTLQHGDTFVWQHISITV